MHYQDILACICLADHIVVLSFDVRWRERFGAKVRRTCLLKRQASITPGERPFVDADDISQLLIISTGWVHNRGQVSKFHYTEYEVKSSSPRISKAIPVTSDRAPIRRKLR